MNQKRHQVAMKIARLVKYIYVLPFKMHDNHINLCLMTNIDVEKLKLHCHLFDLSFFFLNLRPSKLCRSSIRFFSFYKGPFNLQNINFMTFKFF